MSEKKKQTRRDFFKDFAVITGGAAVGVGVPSVMLSKKAMAGAMTDVPKSGVVVHNPEICRGCKICEVGCSAYHDGICSSYLSRIQIDSDAINFEWSGLVCAQCDAPSCYFVCPEKDKAMCIDKATGVRYVNEAKCVGCGKCAEACPLPEPPVRLKTLKGKEVSFKCDLCKGRQGGPICVELCPRIALTFEERRD